MTNCSSGARLPERWGLLVLDKPEGMTSHTAVRRAQRALGATRAGHAGTLDPLASGVLLVGLNRATRLLEYLVGHDKVYRAVVRLGEVRDTLDREGTLLETRPVPALTAAAVEAALEGLRGAVDQVPPVYSAIKVRGTPLHRRVRRGEEVTAPSRRVTIRRLDLLELCGADLTLEVECSSGTYVRSIARDLGEALGAGASLWALRRLRSGPFGLGESAPLAEVEAQGEGAWARVRPAEEMVGDVPAVRLTGDEAARFRVGLAVGREGLPDGADVVAFDADGDLLAIGRPEGGQLRPTKVFRPAG